MQRGKDQHPRTRAFMLMIVLLAIHPVHVRANPPPEEESTKGAKMTLVLVAPSVHDTYYQSNFQEIIQFQADYANQIRLHDEVKIVVDEDTKKAFAEKVPDEVFILADVYDIWVRDFGTVNPRNPVQFVYSHASMSKRESRRVQKSFNTLADRMGIKRTNSNLVLDGGNLVDNHRGYVITTTRFLTDNGLTMDEGRERLKDILGATHVAVIEPDEEVLAHADGMVAFIDEQVLLVNRYDDAAFRETLLNELKNAFPDVRIIEVPVDFQESKRAWAGFESACGINLNLVLTHNAVYVPVFHSANDENVLAIIRENTTRQVVAVDATGVCAMGGSVRCLTWQVENP